LNAEVVNSTAYFFTHFNKSGDQYLGTAFGTDGGVDPAFHGRNSIKLSGNIQETCSDLAEDLRKNGGLHVHIESFHR